mmetsp:Transcript_31238/g.70669  ORF Transcript_31238/g.70669 Transcript_31238/m.70669 type:complete len:157 (+) Transcript_31238:47-517(+)
MKSSRSLLSSVALLAFSLVEADPTRSIETIMCDTQCDQVAESTDGPDGCMRYTTPLNECYNAALLFPGDESWSDVDIIDTIVMKSLNRRFFTSKDSTCQNDKQNTAIQPVDGGDSFVIPFDECVGPFGPPRPWGKFTLIESSGEKHSDEDAIVSVS